jgi:hypothetical protein
LFSPVDWLLMATAPKSFDTANRFDYRWVVVTSTPAHSYLSVEKRPSFTPLMPFVTTSACLNFVKPDVHSYEHFLVPRQV